MLRDAAVDILMARLGQRKDATTKQSIINEMTQVQENILEGDATLFWFLLTTEQTLFTISGNEAVAIPTDFLQDWEIAGLSVLEDDGSKTVMKKEDWNVIVDQVIGDGRPYYYDIVGEEILFRLKPDAVYTLYWRYYQRQTDLTGAYGGVGNIENGWLKYASDLFIGEVGLVIAGQYLQSKTMVGQFKAQADLARARLIKKNTQMEEVMKQRFMEG